jgi:hypothetical protein
MTLRVSTQNWIPAFAGMTDFVGWAGPIYQNVVITNRADTGAHAPRAKGRSFASFCSALLVSLPIAVQAAPSFLFSAPTAAGEWRSAGANLPFEAVDLEQSVLRAQDRDGDGQTDYIEFVAGYNTPGRFLILAFGTNAIPRPLAVGVYSNAERAPFATAGRPGLDIGVNGLGCNTVDGSFEVRSFRESSAQQVSYFDALFSLTCGSTPLTARFTYDASGAPISFASTPTAISTMNSLSYSLLTLSMIGFATFRLRTANRTSIET